MGREIELKIPLTEDQYNNILKNVISVAEKGKCNLSSAPEVLVYDGNTTLVTKNDANYSRYKTREERIANNEPTVIRIREEAIGNDRHGYFTIKRKTFRNGMEINEENETSVEHPEVILQLLEEAGYSCWFRKMKTAYSCYCSFKDLEFHVELVKVNGLPYLEIEVTSEDQEASIVTASLETLVAKFGLDPAKKDSRPWIEIVNS